MNRLNFNGIVLSAFLVGLLSCTDIPENQPGKDSAALLHSAPYKSVTDSIDRFPKNPELYLRRAGLLSQNNMHEMATADYAKSWELSGDESIALRYVSNLLMVNDIGKAVEILKEGVRKFPENTEFNRRLAEVYTHQGKYTMALEQYNNMLSGDSTNFEAWFDRGNLLVKMKDTDEAIKSLETSFALLPINYSGIALANLYITKKDPRALEVCNILMAKDSNGIQTEPLFMKGIYYAEVKNYRKALETFDECIKRDWKMTDAYIEKGIIYYERKNYSEALKVFNMAATVSNTDADAYYWIGRCFESTGNKKEAVANYQRAFALDETFSEAREALRRLNG